MKIVVFTGPSLPPEQARTVLSTVTYLPPVQQGDVYRVAQAHPVAIGIIDGYFEHVPSVWHKEILWALSQGIHVLGSSSMGALRAAELHAFGMEGVGKVFEAFATRQLEDDDEVAVTHGPNDMGYLAGSEAMVNIRFTCQRATQDGIIGPETSEAIVAAAKALFYPLRHYSHILPQASEYGASAGGLAAFRAWLPGGRVDQKRKDALSLLRILEERSREGFEPKHAFFTFQHTDVWDYLTAHVGDLAQGREDSGSDTVLLDRVLDEVRLCGPEYARSVYDGAMARHFALAETRRSGLSSTPETLSETIAAFGLGSERELAEWQHEQGLDENQVLQFFEEEDLLRRLRARGGDHDRLRMVPNYLRREGSYPYLLRRAQDKQSVLADDGLQNPTLSDAGFASVEELIRWYFEQVLARPLASDGITGARQLGFVHVKQLEMALLREYLYRQQQSTIAGAAEGSRELCL
jgi:hypothetical protein